MKANINHVGKKERETIAAECEKYIRERQVEIQEDSARRTMKILCVALRNQFEFDADKCRSALREFVSMSEQRDKYPETFWWNIDKVCTNELKLGDLLEKEDYEEMDE